MIDALGDDIKARSGEGSRTIIHVKELVFQRPTILILTVNEQQGNLIEITQGGQTNAAPVVVSNLNREALFGQIQELYMQKEE